MQEIRSAQLNQEIQAEAVRRIIEICHPELRPLLEEVSLSIQGNQVYCHCPPELRPDLIGKLRYLHAAIAYVSPAEKVVLQSNELRDRAFSPEFDPYDERLIDLDGTLKKQIKHRETEYSKLRSQRLLAILPNVVDICDRQGTILDCNYTEQSFCYSREAALGKSLYELFPSQRDGIHGTIKEAFRYQERPSRREMILGISGYQVRFGIEMVAYGGSEGEAITTITPLNHVWIDRA